MQQTRLGPLPTLEYRRDTHGRRKTVARSEFVISGLRGFEDGTDHEPAHRGWKGKPGSLLSRCAAESVLLRLTAGTRLGARDQRDSLGGTRSQGAWPVAREHASEYQLASADCRR